MRAIRILFLLLTCLGASVAQGMQLQLSVTVRDPANANSTQIADLQLTQDGQPVAWPAGTTVTADGTSPGNEGVANILDGNAGTKGLVFTTTGKVVFTFTTSAVTFNGYQFRYANDHDERDPVAGMFKIDGKDAGSFSYPGNAARLSWSSVFPAALAPAPALVAAEYCWSLNPFVYRFDELLPADSSYYTDAISWVSDCGPVEVVLYTVDELKQARAAAAAFVSRDGINAWVRAQPVRAYTASEKAAVDRLKAKYAPPVAPAVRFVVASLTGSTTRPVYKLRADGTLNTKTDVSGVRAPIYTTTCGARYASTSYYSVKGQPDANGVPMGDVYAQCVAVQ